MQPSACIYLTAGIGCCFHALSIQPERGRKSVKIRIVLMALLLAMVAGLSACKKEEEGTMEKMGKAMDKAAHDTADAVEEAAHDAERAVEDAADEVKDAVEDAKD